MTKGPEKIDFVSIRKLYDAQLPDAVTTIITISLSSEANHDERGGWKYNYGDAAVRVIDALKQNGYAIVKEEG